MKCLCGKVFDASGKCTCGRRCDDYPKCLCGAVFDDSGKCSCGRVWERTDYPDAGFGVPWRLLNWTARDAVSLLDRDRGPWIATVPDPDTQEEIMPEVSCPDCGATTFVFLSKTARDGWPVPFGTGCGPVTHIGYTRQCSACHWNIDCDEDGKPTKKPLYALENHQSK